MTATASRSATATATSRFSITSVIATHADQALALLDDPTAQRAALAGRVRLQPQYRGAAFRSGADAETARGMVKLEPFGGSDDDERGCPTVTYWMNSLQSIPHDTPLFVTLNPQRQPRDDLASRNLSASAVRFCGDPRRSGSCGRCRAAATPGFAAPISAPASMRTACRPALPSPKRSAACGGRGTSPTNPAALSSAIRAMSAADTRSSTHDVCVRHSMSARSCTGGCARARIVCAIACSGCCSISTRSIACRAPAAVLLQSLQRSELPRRRPRRRQHHAAARQVEPHCAAPASKSRRPDPAPLHAADLRLRLQSAQHLFLLSAATDLSPPSSTRSTIPSVSATAI